MTARVDMLGRQPAPADRSAILRSHLRSARGRESSKPRRQRRRVAQGSIAQPLGPLQGDAGDQPRRRHRHACSRRSSNSSSSRSAPTVGAILLKEPDGDELAPKAVRWREAAGEDERMEISRTITDHVLNKGEGVITSDAPGRRPVRTRPVDPQPWHSRGHLRPRSRDGTRRSGVLYADVQRPAPGRDLVRERSRTDPSPASIRITFYADGCHRPPGRPGDREHHALRGQASRPSGSPPSARPSPPSRITSRTSSRGSAAVQLPDRHGPQRQGRRQIVRRGWGIVEKNQAKIYNLVMDMLSYSKDREPAARHRPT